MKLRRIVSSMWFGVNGSRWGPLALVYRLVSRALMPIAILVGMAAARRRRRFLDAPEDAERLPVPVVVVGNLTVGGAGKTPLVIALIEALRSEGYTPGVVSRGYGGSETKKADAVAAVEAHALDAADRFGDEPVLIARRTGAPTFVGRRRADAGRALLAAHPEVDLILSDDGLQHYALSRNFEIAVFDARGAGNGRMLPAGPLREPLDRVGDVDAVVLNGKDTLMPVLPEGIAPLRPPFRMELIPGDAYRVNDPTQTRTLASFRGKRITAAAGIGNPQRFFTLLRGLGLSFHRMPLNDHHRYRENPFATRTSEVVLMTEKDGVKCGRFDEKRMWAIPVSARVDPALLQAILGHVGGTRIAALPIS